MNSELTQSTEPDRYAPEAINSNSSVESITDALLLEALNFEEEYYALTRLLAITARRIKRGKIDADDLARLSVLALVDDRLQHVEGRFAALRTLIDDLRRHRKLVTVKSKRERPSRRALDFATYIASCREQFADEDSSGRAV